MYIKSIEYIIPYYYLIQGYLLETIYENNKRKSLNIQKHNRVHFNVKIDLLITTQFHTILNSSSSSICNRYKPLSEAPQISNYNYIPLLQCFIREREIRLPPLNADDDDFDDDYPTNYSLANYCIYLIANPVPRGGHLITRIVCK